jgi:hypothetical protein
MTAYITIPVASRSNVLRVANGALRYKPDLTAEQVRALYQKYGLDEGGTRNSTADAAPKQSRPRPAGQEGGGSDMGQVRTPTLDIAVLWKLLPDSTLQPIRVRTGITDHTVTEVTDVLAGNLSEGDQLVTGAMSATKTSAPGMGTPRR